MDQPNDDSHLDDYCEPDDYDRNREDEDRSWREEHDAFIETFDYCPMICCPLCGGT